MSMDASSELAQIAKRLETLARQGARAEVAEALDRLFESAEEVGKSASGSWLGYQAYIYYGQVEVPPPGVHFDREWGKMVTYSGRTNRNWIEHDPSAIVEEIHRRAGSPDLMLARTFNDEAQEEIEKHKSNLLSIIQVHLNQDDPYLKGIREGIDGLTLMGQADVVNSLAPKSQIFTRDGLAMSQGRKTPPHLSVQSEIIAIKHTRGTIKNMIKIVNDTLTHLSRQRAPASSHTTGNVFIGHGRTDTWRELKDFIESRLGLSTDEFNRVPVAGVPNTERLLQMLNTAAMAFLVMTGEDEQHDGQSHARLNVVHEAGLFQGRLGFARAIVLLEDGCEEFSNIAGLGQLRFSKGDIRAVFEDVREVLEREGLLKT